MHFTDAAFGVPPGAIIYSTHLSAVTLLAQCCAICNCSPSKLGSTGSIALAIKQPQPNVLLLGAILRWRYDYGGTEEYHGREFDMKLLEKDAHLLLDPRLCRGNADRIVRVWEPQVKHFRSNTLDEPTAGEEAAAAEAEAAAAAEAQAAGTFTAAVSAAGRGPARTKVSWVTAQHAWTHCCLLTHLLAFAVV